MTKDTRAVLRKTLHIVEREQVKIAKARDNIRHAVSDIEAILESCDRGLCDLDREVDTLSQYL